MNLIFRRVVAENKPAGCKGDIVRDINKKKREVRHKDK